MGRHNLNSTLAMARLPKDLFFFLTCDIVSKLGKMSTAEKETSVE